MSGYQGYSKSYNAIAAEKAGKTTLSLGGKLIASRSHFTQKQARFLLEHYFFSGEYHHTSKNYNRTNYYDTDYFLEALEAFKVAGEPEPDIELFVAAVEDDCGNWADFNESITVAKAAIAKAKGE